MEVILYSKILLRKFNELYKIEFIFHLLSMNKKLRHSSIHSKTTYFQFYAENYQFNKIGDDLKYIYSLNGLINLGEQYSCEV